MAKKLNLLVDTDVFIDHLNHQLFREIFTSKKIQVYYSVITKKELLSKEGLKDSEIKEIRKFLMQFRMVSLNSQILQKYSDLRIKYPQVEKEDCLIAATAIVKKFPLVTRNRKHFKVFQEVTLYFDLLSPT
jgi:hypothetical protein